MNPYIKKSKNDNARNSNKNNEFEEDNYINNLEQKAYALQESLTNIFTCKHLKINIFSLLQRRRRSKKLT